MYHLTRQNVGFAVETLEPSELIFRILMQSMENDDWDSIVFFETLSKAPTAHLCSNMHISEAYSFQGPVIATSLKTAYKLIQFPSPKPKFFFLNDLEWLRFPQKQYKQLESIYRNKELTLITRSQDHKKLVESSWNRPVEYVVENYDFYSQNFLDYLKGKVSGASRRIKPVIEYKEVRDYLT
jgi:hypothetical protein